MVSKLPQFCDGEPDAAEYERLAAISAEEIDAVDPGAELILAPLSPAPKGVRPARFLADIFRAAEKRGGGSSFDQISVNPYGASIREVRKNVERVVAAAKREVGFAPPMLIAEIAWGSAGPRKSFLSGTRKSQAKKLRRAYRMFPAPPARVVLDQRPLVRVQGSSPRSDSVCLLPVRRAARQARPAEAGLAPVPPIATR